MCVCPHLQGDVGLGPVLDVLKLNVRVSVHEVDADQLLTALTLEAGGAPTRRRARPLHAGGAVLTLSQLARGRGDKGHLAELSTDDDITADISLLLFHSYYEINKYYIN